MSVYVSSAITSSPNPNPCKLMSPCHHVRTGLPSYSWTCRLVASVLAGSGLNHTSAPLGSRIIGPAWPVPPYGATNTSPAATAGDWAVTVTAGGCSSGRE